MHGMLMRRADGPARTTRTRVPSPQVSESPSPQAPPLAGCTGESDEEPELRVIVDAIEAYEAKGKEPGGKG